MHPWTYPLKSGVPHQVPSITTVHARKLGFSGDLLEGVLRWASSLKWSPGSVTNMELAVDFECSSGLLLPGEAPVSLCKRAKVMRAILIGLDSVTQGGAVPGRRLTTVNTLRTVGAKSFCLSGRDMRPTLAGGARTRKVLEELIPTAITTRRMFCADLFPEYGPPPKVDSGPWRFVLEPREDANLGAAKPRKLGPDEVRYTGRGYLCHPHGKPKCTGCESVKKFLNIKECCEMHHHEGDGLPIRACERHRMTSCGPCKSIYVCCKNGHHGCKAHDLPACGACESSEKVVRPFQCCKLGHHASASASKGKPASKPAPKGKKSTQPPSADKKRTRHPKSPMKAPEKKKPKKSTKPAPKKAAKRSKEEAYSVSVSPKRKRKCAEGPREGIT